jgi:hypothetical protein
MKFPLLWGLSASWALFFLWMATERFQHSWGAEGSMFSLFTAPEKFQAFLAGTGAITIGSVPLLLTYGLRRFNKSREKHRLVKERNKIDRRLKQLDAKQKSKPSAASDAAPTAPGSE